MRSHLHTDPDTRPGAAAEASWPPVSVIIPVLNEEHHLRSAVEMVLDNGYPGAVEIALAVGPSRDRTVELAHSLRDEYASVIVVENASGNTPSALNRALEATTHPFVVRVDAHSYIPHGYIERVVALLMETGAANVGGRMHPSGHTPLQEAIAYAMSSRAGIGGANFHVGGRPGPSASVYLGAFPRAVLEQHGGYDEHFLRAQDWELNYRIRQAGGTVWFEPSLEVGYSPRRSYRDLIRQFFRSGQWRRELIRIHPASAAPRYLAPPAATAALAGSLMAAAAGATTGRGALRGFLVVPLTYAAALVAVAASSRRSLSSPARRHLPLVLTLMHVSWGAGFIVGLPASQQRPVRSRALASRR